MAGATATATATTTENATGFEGAKFKLAEVPIKKIRLGKYSLRDVDRNSEDYQRLRDSIAATAGPLLPILLREIDDPENMGKTAFGLIDGLQRFSCCSDLDFTNIPARIINMDDADVAAAQIIANHSRIDTKPVEYTKQLHRMLNANPTLTLEELSDRLSCSVKWLKDRLSLAKLHDKIAPLVDEGKITLSHAFALVKLNPPEEQLNFVEQAQTQTIQEFSGHVSNRVKALREAARAGRPDHPEGFVPVPHMRNLRTIKEEFEANKVAHEVCHKLKAKTAEEGFKAALTWVLSMDPDTVILLAQKDADRKKASSEDKEKKAKEKAAKRLEEARKTAQSLGLPETPATDVVTDDEEEEDEDN